MTGQHSPTDGPDDLQQRVTALHEEFQRAVRPANAWRRGRRPSGLRSVKAIEQELTATQAALDVARRAHRG